MSKFRLSLPSQQQPDGTNNQQAYSTSRQDNDNKPTEVIERTSSRASTLSALSISPSFENQFNSTYAMPLSLPFNEDDESMLYEHKIHFASHYIYKDAFISKLLSENGLINEITTVDPHPLENLTHRAALPPFTTASQLHNAPEFTIDTTYDQHGLSYQRNLRASVSARLNFQRGKETGLYTRFDVGGRDWFKATKHFVPILITHQTLISQIGYNKFHNVHEERNRNWIGDHLYYCNEPDIGLYCCRCEECSRLKNILAACQGRNFNPDAPVYIQPVFYAGFVEDDETDTDIDSQPEESYFNG